MKSKLSLFASQYRRLLGMSAAVLALGIAGIYTVILPAEVHSAQGIDRVILMYAHAATWLLLSAASGLWAIRGNRRIVSTLSYFALVSYLSFLAVLVWAKFN